ncbi:MAG: tRNA pseudouridine(55) synthase [Acidimicrobiales bacterium]|jgi:tRNA pseudouridine(55) synthase
MELPELLLIDKPSGMTSFDVVYQVRRKLNPKPKKASQKIELKRTHGVDAVRGAAETVEEDVQTSTATNAATAVEKHNATPWIRLKVGHAGTLDPLATGLMIIGIGKGTKKLTGLVKLDKEYIAEVRIGESRTTGDLEGEIVEEKTVEDISLEEISSTVASLIGTHYLPVSAYSAIKKDGKPMYKRAREAEKKGEVVTDVPMREMTVHETEVLKIENTTVNRSKRVVVTVRFFVASGVYVRSLGEELGKRLGYPAVLQNLRRTKVGEFDIEDAQNLEDLL